MPDTPQDQMDEKNRARSLFTRAEVVAEWMPGETWRMEHHSSSTTQKIFKSTTSTLTVARFSDYYHGSWDSDPRTGGTRVEVHFRGELVFQAGGPDANRATVQKYVPGEWEQGFEKAYQEALKKLEATRQAIARDEAAVEEGKKAAARLEQRRKHGGGYTP